MFGTVDSALIREVALIQSFLCREVSLSVRACLLSEMLECLGGEQACCGGQSRT